MVFYEGKSGSGFFSGSDPDPVFSRGSDPDPGFLDVRIRSTQPESQVVLLLNVIYLYFDPKLADCEGSCCSLNF